MSTKTKPGRPAGAKNKQVPQSDGQLTRCRCGSTRRTEYFNRRVLAIAGINPATGEEYTQIVIRRTSCADCGQLRDDRHFVFEPVTRGREK